MGTYTYRGADCVSIQIMDINFVLAEEEPVGIDIDHVSINNLPVNPDGSTVEILASGIAIPSDFQVVYHLDTIKKKDSATGQAPRKKGKKGTARELDESDLFTFVPLFEQETTTQEAGQSDDVGPTVKSVYALHDLSDEAEHVAALEARKRKKMQLQVSGEAAKKRAARNIDDREKTLMYNNSSSFSLPDMDLNDDTDSSLNDMDLREKILDCLQHRRMIN